MTPFDFAFTIFGLVLGLALTATLTGFVNVLKARSASPTQEAAIRMGWLTPLLAIVVIVDLITFWTLAWASRTIITLELPVLVFGAILTSLYFITASLVFPDDPTAWPDLDDWFDRHKAKIGAGIGLANLGFSAVDLAHGGSLADIPILQYAYIALVFGLIVTRRRWQSLAVLGALVTMMAWGILGLPVI